MCIPCRLPTLVCPTYGFSLPFLSYPYVQYKIDFKMEVSKRNIMLFCAVKPIFFLLALLYCDTLWKPGCVLICERSYTVPCAHCSHDLRMQDARPCIKVSCILNLSSHHLECKREEIELCMSPHCLWIDLCCHWFYDGGEACVQ